MDGEEADDQFYSIKNVEAPIYNYDKWEPGYTSVKVLGVQNKGSLALKYRLDIVAQGNSGTLGDVIDVYIKKSDSAITSVPSSFNAIKAEGSGYEKVGTLSSLINKDNGTVNGKLVANNSSYFAIALHMQESAGNNYQDANVATSFDIALNATQLNSEQDGFGNPDYDINANPNAVFGADNIKAAMNNPDVKEVVLGEDINLNKKEFKDEYGNCTFNVANGKTLDLGGNNFIRPDGGSGNGLAIKSGNTATIENGNVIAEGDMIAVDLAEGSTTTFKKVNFKGHGNELVKARAKAETTTTIVFKECTFENAPVNIAGRDGATHVNVKFENCTFEGTYKMYDKNGKPLADKHGNIHYTNWLIDVSNYVYGNIVLDNCTMNFDASEASSNKAVIGGTFGLGCSQGENLNITLDNVTIKGKKVIPIKVDSRWDKTVKIIEKGNTTYTVNDKKVNYDGSSK